MARTDWRLPRRAPIQTPKTMRESTAGDKPVVSAETNSRLREPSESLEPSSGRSAVNNLTMAPNIFRPPGEVGASDEAIEYFAGSKIELTRSELLNHIATRGYNVAEPTFDLIPLTHIASAVHSAAYSSFATNSLELKENSLIFMQRFDQIIQSPASTSPEALKTAVKNLREDVALYFTDAINLSTELARTVEDIPQPHTILEALPESMIPGEIKSMAHAVSEEIEATDTVTAIHINKITDNSLNTAVDFESYSAPYIRNPTASRTDQLIHEKMSFLTQNSMRRASHQLPLTYAEKRAIKLNGPTIQAQSRVDTRNQYSSYAASQSSLALPEFQSSSKSIHKSSKRKSRSSSPGPHRRARIDSNGGHAASQSRSTSAAHIQSQPYIQSDDDDEEYVPARPRSAKSDTQGEERYEWPTPTMPNQQAPLSTDHTGLVWKYVMPTSGRKRDAMRAICNNLNIGLGGRNSRSMDARAKHLENHINSNQLGYSQVGLNYGKMVPESSSE